MPLSAVECSSPPLPHVDSSHLTPTPMQYQRLHTDIMLDIDHHIGASYDRLRAVLVSSGPSVSRSYLDDDK